VLPVFALCLVGDGDLVLGDGEDEVGMGEGLLLSGAQGREADFLSALFAGVCVEESLLGAFANGLWW
jgi:hypothetical protein